MALKCPAEVKRSESKKSTRHLAVTSVDYDLGYFDLETRVFETLENPFGPKVLPMSQVRCVTDVSGLDQKEMVGPWGLEPQTSTVSR